MRGIRLAALLTATLLTCGCTATAARKSAPPDAARGVLTLAQATAAFRLWDQRADSTSTDPAYWRGLLEAAPFDQRLDEITRARHYGWPTPPPFPTVDPALTIDLIPHTASGDWFLTVNQVAEWVIGGKPGDVEKNTRIRLFHRARPTGSWLMAFESDATGPSALNSLVLDRNRTTTLATVHAGDPAGALAADPRAVCGQLVTYIGATSPADLTGWDSAITQWRTSTLDSLSQADPVTYSGSLTDSEAVHPGLDHAPVLRTTGGGALLFCQSADTRQHVHDPGTWEEFSESGWIGTTGIRWASYTSTTLTSTVLAVPPAGHGPIAEAAIRTTPWQFTGQRADQK
ncbi:hypothetical protein ABIA33_007354 [Streptacidiphilus sp. MAP12-16]|uniref:hypothetical protein n=1 Tax=Streptacidiphilus sp. MAP12-16 TaxID=3156300 RepID=UPI003514CEB9